MLRKCVKEDQEEEEEKGEGKEGSGEQLMVESE